MRLPSLLVMAALLVAACSNDKVIAPPAAPNAGSTVALVLRVTSGPGFTVTGAGQVETRCDFQLDATYPGTAAASWLDGVLRLYAPTDAIAPIDSLALDGAATASLFGGTALPSAGTTSAHFYITYGRPYVVETAFRYAMATGGALVTVRARQRCGLVPSGPVAAPIIQVLGQVPPRTVIGEGDTLAVAYRARAAAGLNSAFLRYDGPCSATITRAAALSTDWQDTVRFVIPPGCRDSIPMSLSIRASDALGRNADSAIAGPARTQDLVAPLLTANILIGGANFQAGAPPFQLYQGDVVGINAVARDLGRVKAIYYSAGAQVDSVTSSTGTQLLEIIRKIVLPAGPNPRIEVWARDAAGNLSAPLVIPGGRAVAAPTVPLGEVTWNLPPNRVALATDGHRQRLFVMQARMLIALDASTGSTLFTIPLPAPARTLSVTPSGDSALVFVASTGTLLIADVRTNTPVVTTAHVASFDATPDSTVVGLAAMKNDKVLFLTFSLVPRVHEFDLHTGTSRIRSDGPTTGRTMARSADGSAALIWDFSTPVMAYLTAPDSFRVLTPPTLQGIGDVSSGGVANMGGALGDLATGTWINNPALDPNVPRAFLGDGTALVWWAVSAAGRPEPSRLGSFLVPSTTGIPSSLLSGACLARFDAIFSIGPRGIIAVHGTDDTACRVDVP